MAINRKLMASAIQKWGVTLQTDLTQEECGELIVAIAHYKRGRPDSRTKLLEEIADVTIMAYQMAMMFGENDVVEIIDRKMNRLAKRLDAGIYNEDAKPPADAEHTSYLGNVNPLGADPDVP